MDALELIKRYVTEQLNHYKSLTSGFTDDRHAGFIEGCESELQALSDYIEELEYQASDSDSNEFKR